MINAIFDSGNYTEKTVETGVQITVITTDLEEAAYGNSDVFYELIRTMQ